MSESYPAKQGWLRLTLTLKEGTVMGDEQARAFASCGRPESCEFGPVTRRGRQVKIIFRELKTTSPS
ncbi:MAG: hypothetical protein V4726_00995 [Verrucomicrobiota bacterium]